ncbi:MAG TPA: hypothetical protein VGU68_12950 [Ktedonobacteraceae bacterium]|nr:hypothetical protein [Ktedonobacteraceae bacterium]
MERTEPRRSFGDRVRAFQRPAPPRARGSSLSLNSSLLDILLIVGVGLALIGAGIAFYVGGGGGVNSPVIGIIALIGFTCIFLAVVIGWWARFRGVPIAPRRVSESTDNVVHIGTRRRGLFAEIGTQYRILKLKLRYLRQREH